MAIKTLRAVVLSLLVAFSFWNVTSAAALTSDQIQAILSLVRSFGVDEGMVKNVDDSLNGRIPGTVTEPVKTETFCYTWNKNLTVDSSGADVRALNQALSLEDISDRRVSEMQAFDENTAAHVVKLQQKYSITPLSGYVGPKTRAKLNQLYGCKKKYEGNVPVIIGVSGPQTLGLNQEGTWTVKASSATGGTLSYSVVWGDENISSSGVAMQSAPFVTAQAATFTHVYAKAGVYSPIFTVTTSNTIACITTPCPPNEASAKTSMSVNVRTTTASPSVTLYSPNGGEVWSIGSSQNIQWKDTTWYPPCDYKQACAIPLNVAYDIKLVDPSPPCTGMMCPAYAYRLPYVVATGVTGAAYTWTVGNVSYEPSNPLVAPTGSYRIQICRTGTDICDTSDALFTLSMAPISAY